MNSYIAINVQYYNFYIFKYINQCSILHDAVIVFWLMHINQIITMV